MNEDNTCKIKISLTVPSFLYLYQSKNTLYLPFKTPKVTLQKLDKYNKDTFKINNREPRAY